MAPRMARKLAFDVTHLASRLPIETPSGIDKVDLAFAEYLTERADILVHYGLRKPRFHSPAGLASLTHAGSARWGSHKNYGDDAWAQLSSFLAGSEKPIPVAPVAMGLLDGGRSIAPVVKRKRRVQQNGWRFSRSQVLLPENAIYLNVAQFAFEYERFFRWLPERPDLMPVFMVHDLLPLDYPEYFRPGYKQRFTQRTRTILTHAKAVLAASAYVKERLERAYSEQARAAAVPIHVTALPSSLPPPDDRFTHLPELADTSYFVVLGTIEPRKNHLLLLNIWRRMAEQQSTAGRPSPAVPKLIIVGSRGWENEQVVDILDRSALVRPHVLEISNLDDARLAVLIANARGLLFPSFAEGYGLPLVEALSLKTPVIASDIPVFREVSQGCALFASPLDGPRWLNLVQALSDPAGEQAISARHQARTFVPPTWTGYFESVQGFLSTL
ncbi:MAG: glycosyltransferase family 1 protein [Pseudomonadota bacterium]